LLDFAVLGLLHDSPMHGYELKKRLNSLLGSLRAFSYGSLYPCLRRLTEQGLITAEDSAGLGKRSKVVYTLTAEGKEHLDQLLREAGPTAWEDESFGVHFAFFAKTPKDVRLRILEGRRTRLEERREGARKSSQRTTDKIDRYTLALQSHALEAADREVRWLSELIDAERNQK
jgi:DNA-binding PadR family transcriptional regulator